jgi:site-specific recombinase XerD
MGAVAHERALTAHPHMLRHAYGFALADRGADTRLIQHYLGDRNIQHPGRYTGDTKLLVCFQIQRALYRTVQG